MSIPKEIPENITDLLESQRITDVTHRLMAALDAQALEKTLLEQMVTPCSK